MTSTAPAGSSAGQAHDAWAFDERASVNRDAVDHGGKSGAILRVT